MATKVKLIADGIVTADQLTLTTASTGTNTTAPATTAFVQQEVAALVDSSPDALNTLNELAAALGDDANFSTTVTNSIATKLPLAGGTLTGALTVSATTATINITGGSSGASLINFGDSDDGNVGRIYYDHTNNFMQFKAGDAERMRIDSSGNVGIGTSSPNNQSKLSLQLPSGTNGRILTMARSAGAYAYHLGIDASSRFNLYNNDGTSSLMAVDSSGNVGIGGTSTARLLVQNDGASTVNIVSNDGGIASINFGDASDASRGQIQYENNTEALTFSVNNLAEAMRIDSSGNVGIGETNPDAPLHITSNTPIISFDESDAGQEYRIGSFGGAFALYDSTDAAYRIVVDGSGNIGIGETSPDTILHIKKNQSSANSSIKLENAAGGNNSSFSIDWQLASSGTSAQIKADRTNSPGAGDTDLIFSTSTTGTALVEAMRIDSSGNVGIGVTNPGARLELDNPSSFTNMIEYGNVTWNQNTGHGLVAVNRGSDGYVQLQITSNVDGSDTITVRSSDSSGSGAGLKHNLMADGKAVHSGGLLVGTTTQPTSGELDGTGQAGNNVITIGDTSKLYPTILMRSSATNGNWLSHYGNSAGHLNTYNTDTNRAVQTRTPNGEVNFPNQPSFHATAPAVTTPGNVVVFGGVGHNTGSHYNTSNGRFTAPVAGKYLFTVSILMQPGANGNYERILFAINGTTSTSYIDNLVDLNYATTASYHALQGSCILNISTNDYVDVHNSGQSNTYGTSYGSFCGQLLS